MPRKNYPRKSLTGQEDSTDDNNKEVSKSDQKKENKFFQALETDNFETLRQNSNSILLGNNHRNHGNHRNYRNISNNLDYSNYSNYSNVTNLQNINSLNSELLTQYMNLLIGKQNVTLLKFDTVDDVLAKLVKENSELKGIVKSLEKQTETLSMQMSDILVSLSTLSSETHYDKYDDNDDVIKSCDDPYCANCYSRNDYYDYNDVYDDTYDINNVNNINDAHLHSQYTEATNKKKSKKSKKNNPYDNNIMVKVQGDFPTGTNPLQMLMEQLTGGNQQKKDTKQDDVNSDDGYDQNAPIYENSDENKENDPNFVELTDKITNIKDLIEIGDKYKDIIDLSIKQKEKKKKHKKSKSKSKLNFVESDKFAELQNGNVVSLDQMEPNISTTSTECLDHVTYYELDGKKYPVNLETIGKLSGPLKRLSKMIGMEKVKEDIFDMIIYYLQGFERTNNNMLHSVIEGPPGVGKTKLGKILASVYCGLGIIPSNKFKYVKATDLIGDHVGATKHMTQTVIDEADGGVLFIDEAYALSSNDNKDPYGKECIDTINFNLSENKKKLIVIIAGYPDHLDKYFFSFNPGLARRFPFKFRIDAYTADELKEIFIDKLRKFGWKFNQSLTMENLSAFFKTNEKEFPNFGGDVENFFKSCQFAHSKRMLGKNPNQRKKFNFDDIKKGLEKFKKNKRTEDPKPQIWKDMFI